MKLPQSWTTVTTLSKIIAILLFVSLPFTGFYFGYKYGIKSISPPPVTSTPKKVISNEVVTPTIVKETIPETVKDAVTKILIEKYNLEKDKVSVQVNKEVGDFASGSVGFGEEMGGGGWLAKKIEGKWEVVWDGNGSVDCQKLRTEYNFPDEILKPSFCD
jgi:hypothetical protein